MRSSSNTRRTASESVNTLAMLALILLAIVPYLNTLRNGLVYDDRLQIEGNPYVHSFRYLGKIFGSTVWTFQGAQGVSNYYRPLMTFAYLICYKFYGIIPFGYHLLNIGLEVVVVLLLFAVTERLFQDRLLALIAAALFALHPMHTESVAWVASLPDLELSVFFLLTFFLYLGLGQQPQTEHGKMGSGWSWRQLPMIVTYVLALLSKEQALMLPVLATIYEHFYRGDRSITSLRCKVSRYAPLWIAAAAYFAFRHFILGGFAPSVARPTLAWTSVLLTAVALAGGYLGKLIWPVHFSAFYVFHEVARAGDPRFLAGVLALLICAILFIWLWRRDHLISFSFIFMGVMLGPVLNARWMPASVFAERYLYLPSVGFCWLLGWAAAKTWRVTSPANNIPPPAWAAILRGAVPVALAVVALSYGALTVRRNRDWRSEDTLYAQTLAMQPDAQLIRTNVGVIDWARGDADAAEREWIRSLGPHRAYAPTLNDLGMVRMKQKRFDEAIDFFQQALAVTPNFMDPHRNLGAIYAGMGRSDDADREFRAAVALDPMSSTARNAYGHYLLDRGRTAEAKEQFARSAEADDNAEADENLGDLYVAENDMVRARQAYQAALALDRFDTKAHFGLGAVDEHDGRLPDAMREYHAGLDTDPTNADALQAVRRMASQLSNQ
jgi:protein O-mannosyl-transferase